MSLKHYKFGLRKCLTRGTMLLALWSMQANAALAQVYGGGGIKTGISQAGGIVGGEVDLQKTILRILEKVLTYIGLVAVVVIVIAGIILITSGGDDAKKDQAKKIIIYTLVGMIVILLASGLVALIAGLA